MPPPISVRTFDLREETPLMAYRLLTSAVVPRPIAFVSTVSKDGVANLAPFSFFMVGGANPPSLMVAPTLNGRQEEKDSLRNIRDTGEFVVNTVHRAMANGMNEASAALPSDQSEWPRTGFTPVPSSLVKPPRVAESLIQLECRLFQVINHGEGPIAARYVLGEVVLMHVDESLWDGEKMRPAELISRLGGAEYLDLADGSRFEMERPSA
jgi:flavin reductase (DIM6/NTAB) family NADH-FMN oxidoreductase RutF